MYNLSHFKEKDKTVLLQFVKKYPFAFVTGSDSAGNPVATQIPMLIEERGDKWILQGHIMRNTDHHKALVQNPNVLAVFTGPQCYVSATWYTNPHIGSTWNYMSVHVNGEVEFMSDDELIAFMKKFTLHFEKENEQSPTIFDNLSKDYLDRMLPMIVGFEIEVKQLKNVFKLSQDKDEKSYRNIINKLEKEGGSSAEVAAEMRKRISELFTNQAD